jgi:hypothetical protein
MTSTTAGPEERAPNHGFLLQVLRWIESAVEGEAVAQLLEDLHQHLEVHFAAEERPRGFFDTVVRTAPWRAATVADLRAAHRTMLADVARLRREITRNLQPVPEPLRQQLEALIAGLRDHEAIEEELLVDTHATDFGGDQ